MQEILEFIEPYAPLISVFNAALKVYDIYQRKFKSNECKCKHQDKA